MALKQMLFLLDSVYCCMLYGAADALKRLRPRDMSSRALLQRGQVLAWHLLQPDSADTA